MDILAARKKAAERARSGKTSDAASEDHPAPPAEPMTPAPVEEPAGSAIASLPPLPDTEFHADDLLMEPQPLSGRGEEHSTKEEATAEPPDPQAAGPQREGASAHPASAPAAAAVAEQEGEAPEQPLEMLAFFLAKEEYVVPVEQVREILTPREITPVPYTADHLLGVCSLRGAVMPVIDLNRRLGLAASDRDEKSRIVVVNLGHDDQVGLFVDRVRGVVRFLPSDVRPAPETVSQGAGAEFLQGIARKDDRLYILLDTEKTIGT